MTVHVPKDTKTKLSIIGAGSVGSSLAYASLIRGSADEIVLYDINEKKVNAEVHDLAHGTQYTPTAAVNGGPDIEVVKDSSIVIITAGARQKPGQTRMDLAAINADIMKSLMPQLLEQAPNAIYVLVTNPCDVLTYVAQKVSGLPASQVFSTGTMLDTSRLRWAIGRRAEVAQGNVHVTIMGEHGDTEFPVWSNAEIGNVPLRDWTDDRGNQLFTKKVMDELEDEAIRAAYKIIEGKGATNYAIGIAGARLVEALLRAQRTILPLSSVLEDYYGITDVSLSVPSIVSRNGIERVLETPLSAFELTKLRRSAEAIRGTLHELGF
ncbi:L-lactate dehydrogenase [Nigerium massiliense]|uniref:L-lactate dehydrogenase n=1 Tax=Nigerium massiliense TaxID=1522317 RepID=UPI000590DFCC|nr:L-lactate dehydrogenase [Nigerium massiliense]